MPLVSTIDAIPIYSDDDDLIDDGQEPGNLAITARPATLWIWFDGWHQVTAVNVASLVLRVERIERLLEDIGDLLAND